MSFKNLLNIIIIFLILVVAGVVLYISLGPGWSGTKVVQPAEKEFDFQVILPEGSIYKLEEIENLEVIVEIAPTIWFEESEEVEISLIQSGKFKFADSFLSESKPFGKVTVSGAQQRKNEETIYLDMSLYVFYRPFAKENLTQELQNSLDSYFWPAENPIAVNSRSTAITCLVNDYLVSSVFSSVLSSDFSSVLPFEEHPLTYFLPSSIEALSGLYELLSHPKFPELQNEVSNLLLTELSWPVAICFEERIANITSEILGEIPLAASEDELEELLGKLPQAKDAEITFQLGQELWKTAVGLGIGNFDELNTANPSVKLIGDKITESGGELIIQKSPSPTYEFCAYSQLNVKRNGLTAWYCIEANGAKCYLTTEPSATCNQNSYTCSCSF